jgi:hypothetical protein
MGNVGGNAHPRKSTNLNPTIKCEIFLDRAKASVAK